ncbi:iron-containing alcohol dehydrogenase, partial [Escherichia coli]
MSTYYFLPTRNVFGEGSVQEAGSLAKTLNVKKILIVTDAFLAGSGMADRVAEIYRQAGIGVHIFEGAEPNPTDKNVAEGIKSYRENDCNGIVSLGGGSSHDCAKGIGLIAANGGNIRDFEGVDKSVNDMIPLMAINTTAGTASEVTRF